MSEEIKIGAALSQPNLTRRQVVAALAATSAMPAIGADPRKLGVTPEGRAKALLESFAENLLKLQPATATTLGVDTGKRASYRFRLGDSGPSFQTIMTRTLRSDLAQAEEVDTRPLTFSTRTSIEVVKSAYRTALEGFALPYGDVAVGGWRNTPYVVIQNVGAYIDTPQFLDADHTIETRSDAEAYLSRLAQYPAQLDGELARMRGARAKGLVPPKFLIDKALNQLGLALESTRKGGSLVDSIVRRTKEKGISGNWGARARKIAAHQAAPALQRQIDELKLERAIATDIPGMWSRPHGDEYYRWALKASTTTTLSPEEIHQMGLGQLAELQGRMDPILKSIGFTKGSVGERMQALAKDPGYKFSEGDNGREEIKAYIQEQLTKIRNMLPRAFNTLVAGNLEVRRMSPEQEPGAPAAYGGPGSIDGKIPGKFWINLRTTDLHSKYSLPDLAAHEAIPGHVWQGEYANKLPLIRAMLQFNAYSEGWALYAEQLVDELGLYDSFPVGRLGYLQSIAFRCCRLVVDTGLHAKHWSRQQAIDFFVQRNGSNPLEVASEVDRYCSWPGQACGYKVGHSTINRLRDQARAELGSKYDLRAFDDAVVFGGNVPMDVLAMNVGDYILSTKQA